MAVRLKNSALLRCLCAAAQIADWISAWIPWNDVVRKIYLRFLPPYVTGVLQKRAPALKIQLLARNSVAEPGAFNIFLSDLDFTLIVDREPATEELRSILDGYARLARSLWFLGELEVYTREEWRILDQVKSEAGSAVDLIWNLRKLLWQKQALASAPSAYHRAKAKRSIRRTFEKLRTPLADLDCAFGEMEISRAIHRNTSGWIRHPEDAATFRGFATYLQWPLTDVSAVFLASLPDGEVVEYDRRHSILAIRERPEVARRFAAVSASELLLCRTKRRFFPREHFPIWEDYLVESIRDYAPGDALWAHELLRLRGASPEIREQDARADMPGNPMIDHPAEQTREPHRDLVADRIL